MASRFDCRDAGHDSGFEIVSEHEDELIDFVQIHGRSAHGDNVSESDVRDMITSS